MDDRIVDPSHARFLRQSIPGAELRLFPATGHLVPVEHPKEVAEAIRDFVRRVETRPLPSESPPSTPGRGRPN
jgi:pimeloyl-ACP methyl ester carboxylesterase